MGILSFIHGKKQEFKQYQEQQQHQSIQRDTLAVLREKKLKIQQQNQLNRNIAEERKAIRYEQRQPLREKLQGVQQFFQGANNMLKDKKLQRNIKQKKLQRLGRGVTSEPNPAFQNESRNVFGEIGNAKSNPAFDLGMKNHSLERPSLLGMKQKKKVNYNVFK